MKVVHCITGLSADGAQRMLLRLAEGLEPLGVSNLVVNLGHEDRLADSFRRIGVPVFSLGVSHPGELFGALYRLRRLLAHEKPTILQGWMYHANCALSLAAQQSSLKHIPLLWNIRRGLDDVRELKCSTRMMIRLSRYLSRSPRRIIYCTEQSKAQHESYGFAPHRGLVVGNGFDTGALRPHAAERSAVLQTLQISPDACVVGHVGRWDPAKGHPFLLEAFARVVGKFPHARLLMVGRGVDDQNQSLRALVSTFSLTDKVHLLGERNDLPQLFGAMDLLCSSSIAEGFPNVVAEAMACGVPCVVTATGASRELVEGIGAVVPTRSVHHLAQALAEMLQVSPEARRALGAEGRRRIEESHSLHAVVKQYAALYAATLGNREPGGVARPPEQAR